MPIEIGVVDAVFRYPVKSMAGEALDIADLGWHGIEGDRRLALRRMDNQGGFPWLTAGKMPDLLLFSPRRTNNLNSGDLPSHVRTPDGRDLDVFGEDLASDLAARYGAPLQMTHLKHGIFDDSAISVICSETVLELSRLADLSPDVRRFRPNIVIRSNTPVAFQEDEWLGGVLTVGEGPAAAAIAVTMRDVRCAMVNLDPDTAIPDPEMMKAVVRANQNKAGIYGAVTRIGQIAVGQKIFFHPAS